LVTFSLLGVGVVGSPASSTGEDATFLLNLFLSLDFNYFAICGLLERRLRGLLFVGVFFLLFLDVTTHDR